MWFNSDSGAGGEVRFFFILMLMDLKNGLILVGWLLFFLFFYCSTGVCVHEAEYLCAAAAVASAAVASAAVASAALAAAAAWYQI